MLVEHVGLLLTLETSPLDAISHIEDVMLDVMHLSHFAFGENLITTLSARVLRCTTSIHSFVQRLTFRLYFPFRSLVELFFFCL